MKRVVFDSNVIVSAFLKPDGVSMKCYKLLFPPNKKIKNFYSKETINDLKSGLRHEKSKITEKDIRKIVKKHKKHSQKTNIKNINIKKCEYDKDNRFLEVAEAENINTIITKDKEHLIPLNGWHEIEITTPHIFYQNYTKYFNP